MSVHFFWLYFVRRMIRMLCLGGGRVSGASLSYVAWPPCCLLLQHSRADASSPEAPRGETGPARAAGPARAGRVASGAGPTRGEPGKPVPARLLTYLA